MLKKYASRGDKRVHNIFLKRSAYINSGGVTIMNGGKHDCESYGNVDDWGGRFLWGDLLFHVSSE